MRSRLGEAQDASVAVATDGLEVDEVAAAGAHADGIPDHSSVLGIPAPGPGRPYPCPAR
jgi:hypothetical protein